MKGSSASGVGSALMFGQQIGPNIPPTVPVNIVPPLITGGAYLNTQLTCSTGTWSGGGTMVFTYQWKRAGVNISGATNSTYTMGTADTVDSLPQISCTVTATNETVTPVAANSSNSKLCTPVITMSCNKIGGSMAFAGSLTRKASPSSVIVQWGDNTNTSVTTTLSKTYSTTGVKNIRVYSELNNITAFNVTTVSTRLVSFVATEIISSINTINISNQSTVGIFTTLTIKNQPNLIAITLTSCALPQITSAEIDNLPALGTLNLGSMTSLTSLSLPVFPVITSLQAGNCTSLASASINNNPTLINVSFSRCLLTSLDISNLINLSILTLGNPSAGNILPTLDVTPNNSLTNLNVERIQLASFTHGTLPNLISLDASNNDLSGNFDADFPALTSLQVDQNQITDLSVTSTLITDLIANSNQLTAMDISGKTVLTNIQLSSNNITSAGVDYILSKALANGAPNGNLSLENQTPAAPPGAQGLLDKAALEADGWTVSVDP